MDLYNKLDMFFKKYFQEISINGIIKNNHLNPNEIAKLPDVLYTLECEGKIISDKKSNYMHIAPGYYLYSGQVESSTHDNFIIHEHGGKVIIINNDKSELYKSLKAGDFIFANLKQDDNYKNKYHAQLIKIIEHPVINPTNFLAKGIIKINSKNNYYVEVNNERYLITQNHLNSAYINDYVTVECFKRDDTPVALVKDIITRKTAEHVFTYKNVGGTYKMVPLATPYYDINFKYNPNEFNEGDNVLLKLDSHNNATFIKRLDNSNTIISKIKLEAYDRGFPIDFPKEVQDYANNITDTISLEEEKSRVDLRDLITFTIDPLNCQDMDDAVSIKRFPEFYRLYVSIADVTHYVKPGDPVFQEAAERTTSIYPSEYCFPMLPQKISNDICSLNEGVDKLTKTCIVDIDYDGNILNSQFVDSIINSNKKMNYDEVNALFDNNSSVEYLKYSSFLNMMLSLSNILTERRVKRGNIVFLNKEVNYEIKDDIEVTGVEEKEAGKAQKIIENFMLIANECVANLANSFDIPFVFRNHEKPDLNRLIELKFKIRELQNYSKELIYSQDPKKLQHIINKICEGKTAKEKNAISNLFIRSLERAYYATNNTGHYALALPAYATFTSPIRRLPDLLNHLIIESIITGNIDSNDYPNLFNNLAEKCSIIQKETEDFERDINFQLLQLYLTKYYNQDLLGTITFIMDNYAYIETKEGINGYIYVNKNNIRNNTILIGNKYYSVNEQINVQVLSPIEHSQEVEFKLQKKLVNKNSKEA